MRDHFLLYALSAIVLLNIIAIVLLQSRITEQEIAAAQPTGLRRVIGPERADVRTVVLTDNRCPDCFDIGQYLKVLNDTVDMNVSVAQQNVAQFKSERLPAVAFNKSFEEYPTLIEGWEEVGSIITIADGEYAGTWYVLPTQNPPYITQNGSIFGRLTVTYITMNECEECYNATRGREWLADFTITPYSEIFIDASSAEGQAIIKRYNLTAVPTVLLSADAREYQTLAPGWGIVGSIENDGTRVLRDLQRLEVVYYDLAQDRVMRP